MILRPRQKAFVERCVRALAEHGNTLGVAPTGAGKTIMLSGVVGEIFKGGAKKACVLAHRDELTQQNSEKFLRVNPDISISVFDASTKDWRGAVTFAMVPTLARGNTAMDMPAFDLLVIDEAHHAAAASYKKIIDHAYRINPGLKLFGVTATPNRGDNKSLRPVFSNVGDQIGIGELIASGHLVKPRTFVIDIEGTQEKLKSVKRTADEFDMREVEAIMNKAPINQAVVDHWKEHAGGRKTVVFCSTVDHAAQVYECFRANGIGSAFVHGRLSPQERQAELEKFTRGPALVIVNVAVLTEGWDYPPTSCVVLLRPSSYKSTMIQMVGRGLRTVDANEYPGIIKTDCIVLDFGTSSLMHGSLEQGVNLNQKRKDEAEEPTIQCPQCGGEIPTTASECSLCGFVFPEPEEEQTDEGDETQGEGNLLGDFVMTEIDLFSQSPFLWIDPLDDNSALIACGFQAWAGVFYWEGSWYAVGASNSARPHLLTVGERLIGLAAANDWLNSQESDASAHKSKRWLNEAPTHKQLAILPEKYRMDYGLTRYKASVLITFQFHRDKIRNLVFTAARGRK